MASVSYQIANLLEKMTSNDKDFRFMATNDLMSELQKDSIKLDDDSERKVVKMLLKLLEDKNGEVQNLAVKCLGPLVNKVKEYQVECIVEALCTNMLSDNEQLRDISSIGLKTVISELPPGSSTLAANVCKKITGRLSSAIEKQEDVSVQLEALDMLADLLSRFGSLLISFHPILLSALIPQLTSPRQAVRKRTIVALSHLAMSCNNTLYNQLIDHLLQGLDNVANPGINRTHIQCIASICRQAGHRFGAQVWRVAPAVLSHARANDDELREHSLAALEAFLLRCPAEVTPHVPTITNLCLEMITYDPNYNYEDSESGDDIQEDENGTNNHEEEDSDEYSDDEDMSWKVRRAAAKCLESVISTRHELLTDLYENVSPILISRFKEREENVKCDILSAYCALVRASKLAGGTSPGPSKAAMRGALRVLRSPHAPRARAAALCLLREFLPCGLADFAPQITNALVSLLGDPRASTNIKIDALSFTVALCRETGGAMQPHAAQLAPALLACADDAFYKVTAEALRAILALVKVIRPDPPEPAYEPAIEFIPKLYHTALARLRAADIDQEVKECAITTVGQILCNLADYLQDELSVCLPIFLERLRNEITRLTTVKALTKVASSPLRIDLSPILAEAIPILSSFLRKNQRALKLATLGLLDALIQNYSAHLSVDLLSQVLDELPSLITESDMHCAQLALTVAAAAGNACPPALAAAQPKLLPPTLTLASSRLLQGAALNALLSVLRALVRCGAVGAGELLGALREAASSGRLHRAQLHSLARAVAAVAASDAVGAARAFLAEQDVPESGRAFALLCVAELGRQNDLSSIPNLREVLLALFSHPTEEVKSAASYTLGSVAIANLPQFLPFILSEIESQPRRQYLLLHSLKEVITWQSSSPEGVESLRPFIPAIWNQLAAHTQCAEEGSRNVVAECLGKLCLLEPEELLPHLRKFLTNEEPLTRITAVTAIKFTISDQPMAIDPLLSGCLGEFLMSVRDPSPAVRRVALVAFNSAAHNKPSLVRHLLPDLLPLLYQETKVNKELIREVEMGPFKHTVDDGLDLRTAAFECMYTLLGTCIDCLDLFEFVKHVESGLKDHYDIKMLTYLMCARLAQLCPAVVLQRLESLMDPLRVTCTTKVKANSVKQEYEKQDELKRSALRAAAALMQIPEADKNPHLAEFVTQIKSLPELQPIFESILKDSSGTGNVDPNLMDQS